MPLYEVITIMSNRVHISNTINAIRRAFGIIPEFGGVIRSFENMGIRPLAYPIRKYLNRHYYARFVRTQFDASPKALSNLKFLLNINENVLRYEVLRLKPSMGMRVQDLELNLGDPDLEEKLDSLPQLKPGRLENAYRSRKDLRRDHSASFLREKLVPIHRRLRRLRNEINPEAPFAIIPEDNDFDQLNDMSYNLPQLAQDIKEDLAFFKKIAGNVPAHIVSHPGRADPGVQKEFDEALEQYRRSTDSSLESQLADSFSLLLSAAEGPSDPIRRSILPDDGDSTGSVSTSVLNTRLRS